MSGRTVYLDATAIATLVLGTTGAPELTGFLRGTTARVTSAISQVEVLRAVTLVEPSALTRAGEVIARLSIVGLDPALVAASSALRPATLSVVGAIHVASAALLADALDALVTYEPTIAAAARAASLRVESPGMALPDEPGEEAVAGSRVTDEALLTRVVDRVVGRLRPDRIVLPDDAAAPGGVLRLAMVPGPWSPGRGASWVAQEAIEDLDVRLELTLVDEDTPEPPGRVLYRLS